MQKSKKEEIVSIDIDIITTGHGALKYNGPMKIKAQDSAHTNKA
jgi:hypothetical protein